MYPVFDGILDGLAAAVEQQPDDKHHRLMTDLDYQIARAVGNDKAEKLRPEVTGVVDALGRLRTKERELDCTQKQRNDIADALGHVAEQAAK